MLATLIETSIGTDNQPYLIIITGVVQAPKVIKTPMIEEFISIMTEYNMGSNRNPQITSRTGVDGSTPVTIETIDVDGS